MFLKGCGHFGNTDLDATGAKEVSVCLQIDLSQEVTALGRISYLSVVKLTKCPTSATVFDMHGVRPKQKVDSSLDFLLIYLASKYSSLIVKRRLLNLS